MTEVHFLPGAERAAQVSTIEYLAKQALALGWKVSRRGPNYLVAVHTDQLAERTEQVTAAVIDGKLHATHTVIIGTTDVSDQVIAWLEGPT